MVGQTQSPWVKQNPSSCLTQCQTEKKSFRQLWYFPILVHLKSGQIREVALYEGDYSYVPQTKFERHIVFVPFLIIFLSFFLSSVKSLSDPFLGDAWIKLYETLQEYHMPCEVVPLRVDFSKMAAIAMETAKMLKKLKTQK